MSRVNKINSIFQFENPWMETCRQMTNSKSLLITKANIYDGMRYKFVTNLLDFLIQPILLLVAPILGRFMCFTHYRMVPVAFILALKYTQYTEKIGRKEAIARQ